jgi:hypothetical protein
MLFRGPRAVSVIAGRPPNARVIVSGGSPWYDRQALDAFVTAPRDGVCRRSHTLSVVAIPLTRYATTGDAPHIAYQVWGHEYGHRQRLVSMVPSLSTAEL